jgi:hypothetical protein
MPVCAVVLDAMSPPSDVLVVLRGRVLVGHVVAANAIAKNVVLVAGNVGSWPSHVAGCRRSCVLAGA